MYKLYSSIQALLFCFMLGLSSQSCGASATPMTRSTKHAHSTTLKLSKVFEQISMLPAVLMCNKSFTMKCLPQGYLSQALGLQYAQTSATVPLGGMVSSVNITPDRSIIVVGGYDGIVRVLTRQADGTYPRTYATAPLGGTVGSVNITPDRSTIVVGGYDEIVRVLTHQPDGTYQQTYATAPLGSMVSSVNITSDRSTIVVGGYDQIIRVLKLQADGINYQQTPATAPLGRSINSVNITPDRSTIVTGGSDQIVRILKLQADDTYQQTYATAPLCVMGWLAIPDASTIVACGDDQIIRILTRQADDINHRQTYAMARLGGMVWSANITSDASTIVVGGLDGIVRVFTFDALNAQLQHLVTTPDFKRLKITGDQLKQELQKTLGSVNQILSEPY